MRQLDAILSTLLLRNNCVIIPSLGGFVANNISAKIDEVHGVIIPPRKALNFNRNLINNDGLIVHFLAAQESISFEEAQAIVNAEVQEIKIDLKKGKRISFTNVGSLSTDRFGKIAFEQDRFFNLLLSSYGMGKVHFLAEEEEVQTTPRPVQTVQKEAPTPTQKAEEAPKTEEKKEKNKVPIITFHPSPKEEHKRIFPKEKELVKQQVPEQTPTQRKVVPLPVSTEKETANSNRLLKRIGKYAAVASLATILFYSIWIPMRTDVLESGVIYSKDFNPFTSTEKATYQSEKQPQDLVLNTLQPTNVLKAIVNNLNSSTAVFAYPLSDDLYIPVRRKGIAPKAKIKTTSPKSKSSSSSAVRNGRYDVVAGCFSNPSNAKDFIKRLKAIGCNAYQVDTKGGLHRISAGNFTNKSSLHALRSKLKQEGIATWILTH